MTAPLEVTDPADDDSPEAQAARYLMTGEVDGESAAGSEDEPKAPEHREFRYRGKAVKVDAATYDVLEELRREARGANGRLGSELAKTRERLARLEGATAARQENTSEPEIKPPDPLLATRDIAAWQSQWDRYHTAKLEQQKTRLEKGYLDYVRTLEDKTRATQRDNEWADRFYSEYEHLDHPDIKPIVGQVYTEHRQEIDALIEESPDEAKALLAEMTDKRLVRLKKAGGAVDPNPTTRRPPRFESSAGPTPRSAVEAPAREFSAASWSARQRLKMSGMEPRK